MEVKIRSRKMDNQIDLEKEDLKEEVRYLRTMNLSLINILEKQTI